MNIIHCSGCGDPFSIQNPSQSENYVEDLDGDLKYIENFCGDCTEERGQEDAYDDVDHDYPEDYGLFGEMGMHED